jgi:hypothetical protein
MAANYKKVEDLIVPTSVVAAFFDVTARQIQRWVKDGGCPKVRYGFFNLKDVFDWWTNNIADIKSGNGNESLNEIKFEYWKAKGEAERVRVDQLKGTLISRAEIYRQWAKRILVLFAGLDQFKNRLPPLLADRDRAEMQKIIESEIIDLQRGLTEPGEHYPKLNPKKGKTCKTKKKKPATKKSSKTKKKNMLRSKKSASKKSAKQSTKSPKKLTSR